MNNTLENIDLNKFKQFLNSSNSQEFRNLYSNASEDEIKRDTSRMLNQFKQLKKMENDPNKLEKFQEKQRNELIENSFKEMSNPDEQRKLLIEEYYKQPPKSRFDIIRTHRTALAHYKQNPIYITQAFNSDAESNSSNSNGYALISRTSNINVKLSKSNCNIEKMENIQIKKLILENTHLNKYLILKIIEWPMKEKSIQLVLEDENNDVLIGAIYNYEKIKKIKNYSELDKEFQIGKYVLIFEPYYKISISKFPMVRLDNPDEVKIFDTFEDFKNYVNNFKSKSSEELQKEGNNYFGTNAI